MTLLKRALLDEYGTFADRRIKRLETGHLFIVDDRTPQDFAADRNLYPWFCSIHVDVVNESEVQVLLRGDVPIGPRVNRWIESTGAKYATDYSSTLEFSVRQGQQEMLSRLASAIRSITAPGAPRYSVPSYKYVCPRTAASLERLKSVLDRAWRDPKA